MPPGCPPKSSKPSSWASTGSLWSAASAAGRSNPSSKTRRSRWQQGSDFALGVQHGQLVAPAGLVNTSAIEDLLRTYVAQARTVADFDRLPIPYRAVATDMVTGKMVVLKEGDLATAMRASMAIPGAFAPVIFKDYILTDGGLVRNIPVDVARETCADVVIVVNLVEPPTPRRNWSRRRSCLRAAWK